MVQVCDSSLREVEAGGLQIQGHPGLHAGRKKNFFFKAQCINKCGLLHVWGFCLIGSSITLMASNSLFCQRWS